MRTWRGLSRIHSYNRTEDPAGFTILDSNTNHFFPADKLAEDLRKRIDGNMLRFYPFAPDRKLKSIVGKRTGTDQRNVVIGGGSFELLDAAIKLAATRGSVIAAKSPFYSQYPKLALLNGCRIRRAREFDGLLRMNTDVFLVCSPNNPDGLVAGRDLVEELCERNSGKLVISDEAYIDYSDEPSAARLVKKYDNLVVTRSVSKWGIEGLRVGFALSAPRIASLLERVILPFTITELAKLSLELCLTKYYKQMLASFERVKSERERIKQECSGFAHLTDSQANFNAIITKNGRLASAFRKNKMIVREYPGFVRVDVATPEINDRVIKAIKSIG